MGNQFQGRTKKRKIRKNIPLIKYKFFQSIFLKCSEIPEKNFLKFSYIQIFLKFYATYQSTYILHQLWATFVLNSNLKIITLRTWRRFIFPIFQKILMSLKSQCKEFFFYIILPRAIKCQFICGSMFHISCSMYTDFQISCVQYISQFTPRKM